MADLIGQSLGRYHILEQLGEGGMATVYKAYDTRLERDVAVKVLRIEMFAPAVLERILKRFEREAKALAKLSHPNIMKVHDFGEYEGKPYLVMEYLPGGTLKQGLGKPMSWPQAVRLLLPVAEALSYAHEHGVLHRDVKPANILLTGRGQPSLTDFGIAKILDMDEGQTLTGTGVGIGTPEYMSPEQGLGKPVDARTDVYSLGVVLYEMITGRKPYQADTPMAVVVKHLSDPLPPPSQFIPDLPEQVEKVLLKAMAKEPANRYENIAAMAAAMEGLLAEAPLPAQPVELAGPPVAVTPVAASSVADVSMLTMNTIDQGLEPVQEGSGTLPDQPLSAPPAVLRPKKSRKSRWWLWLILLVLVPVLAVAAWLFKPWLFLFPPLDVTGCTRDECPDALTIGYLTAGIVQEEVYQKMYVDTTERIFFSKTWCAVDQTTLESNLENLEIMLVIDGVNYTRRLKPSQETRTDSSTGGQWACQTWSAAVSGWEPGESYPIQYGFYAIEEVFDGADVFPMGWRSFRYYEVFAHAGSGSPYTLPSILEDDLINARVLNLEPFDAWPLEGWNYSDNLTLKADSGESLLWLPSEPDSLTWLASESFLYGNGILLKFKFTGTPLYEFHLTQDEWATPDYKRFGGAIYQDDSMVTNIWDGTDNSLSTYPMDGNLLFMPGKWYGLFIGVDQGGGFFFRSWDWEDPSQSVFYSYQGGENWTGPEWTFGIQSWMGTLFVDDFSFVSFDGFR